MLTRTFQGVANHQSGDFIYISEWIGHPADLFTDMDEKSADAWISKTFAGSFGGMLGLPEILLDTEDWVGMMCARWGEQCTRPAIDCKFRKGTICSPPRVRFKATVEVERFTND